MHARQAAKAQSVLRSSSASRAASTAAALKPLPSGLGKWQRTDSPSRPLEQSSKTDLGKWAREAAKQPPSLGSSRRSDSKWVKVKSDRLPPFNGQMQLPTEGSGSRSRGFNAERPSGSSGPSKAKEPERQASRARSQYTPYAELDGSLENQSSRREQKGSFKARGSLIGKSMQGIEMLPSRSPRGVSILEQSVRRRKPKEKRVNPDVAIPSIVSVGNLARVLGVRLETLQNCMRRNGMEEQSSYDHILNADDASILAMEFNRNPVIDDEAAFDVCPSPPHSDYASLPRRPPVVTIMGHVDHGKTTLLDTLRSSSVAKGEAGGITQHIGAFSVKVPGSSQSSEIPDSITFLDTPGHAAFSAMRARGAQCTDIVVLVVAADDGVMPQTKEVIDLIKKDRDKIGVVVAINKVDKPSADVDAVKNALWAEGIELEAMGGDIPSVEVSGLTGQGLEQLVETISLVAELQEIRAEPDGPAHGFVLESKKVKGFGDTATVLLHRGNLTPASHIICGTTTARVRQLLSSSGGTVRRADPGTAVIVTGWKELPNVGDEVLQASEADIKRALSNRRRKLSLEATVSAAEAMNVARRQDREERGRKPAEDGSESETGALDESQTGPKELRLVIKGDVSGSVEALASAVEVIGNNHAITKVIHQSVGEVTESDIALAQASGGVVIAFSVSVNKMADRMANQQGVSVFSSKIIYNVLDHVKDRVIDLLPKTVEKRVIGEANVIQTFDIQGKGKTIVKVAGCRVSNGVVEKDKRVRVVRDGKTVHEGSVSTLRILKRDVTEVKKGLECGMNLTDYSDLRAGDFLQFYQELEKPGVL